MTLDDDFTLQQVRLTMPDVLGLCQSNEVVAIDNDGVVLALRWYNPKRVGLLVCHEIVLVKFPFYQVEKVLWQSEKQDKGLLIKVKQQMKVLSYISIFSIPGFIWMGLQSEHAAHAGKILVYLLYTVVFAFTVSIAYDFRRHCGNLEDAMWSRLLAKPFRMPVIKTSLGFPASCCTALTAIPAYTDALVLSLAIGETQHLWSSTKSLPTLWTTSWAQLPVLCHIMPLISLPCMLMALMFIDQAAHLASFTHDLKGESYADLASAASISGFLFLSDLLNCQLSTLQGNISKGKMLAARHRFFNKVVLGTGLRLWFKVSLLVLLKEAEGAALSLATETTLVQAILTSFMHAITGTMPVISMMFGCRTPDQNELCFNYGPAVVPGGFLGVMLLIFPVWGSLVRFIGAYECESHNFAFSNFGCMTSSNVSNSTQ